ncbi:hypothetical protein K432DRAFT_269057, partial [Lepidopterella palustris CBS 459.81]
RRRSRACVRCNSRKVRCDLALMGWNSGAQCTYCRLDGMACTARPSLRRRCRDDQNAVQLMPAKATSQTSLVPTQQCTIFSEFVSEPSVLHDASASTSFCEQNSNINLVPRMTGQDASLKQKPTILAGLLEKSMDPGLTSSLPEEQNICLLDGHLTFSYFSFLKFDELSSMCPDDVRTLEKHGCLHVPTKPALDRFVREYFLHIHPNLPMLDEGQFWSLYKHCAGLCGTSSRISLFLFQAMLFASCSYVPLKLLQQCGFGSIRGARKTLYRRAKMLFDLEAEHDSYIIAQGALLLSYYSTNSEKHLNTLWLNLAIQSALKANAHHYDHDKSLSKYEKQMSKRLWWCCVLRDRILPLGLRRPLQITHNYLTGGCLDYNDLEDDIGKSEVYDKDTQILLAKTVVALCQLAIATTGVITLLYPSDVYQPAIAACEENFNRTPPESDGYKSKLIQWYETVDSWVSRIPHEAHPSVTLYTSLMYIYYHSARLALCHHEILSLELWSLSLEERHAAYVSKLDNFRGEIRTAAAAITSIIQDLVLLDLVQLLPVSAVAYTALPLVLSALDEKLSTNSWQTSRPFVFDVYTKAMSQYRNQYDGTEEVSSAMNRILLEAELHSRKLCLTSPTAPRTVSATTNPKDWYELFVQHPKLHLRVALSFDISFSRGKFPEDSDLPRELR